MKTIEEKTFLELHGEELLRAKGISKSEFAERMGVKKQNVNTLFTTKNVLILKQVALVLDIPLMQIISGEEQLCPPVRINGFIQVNDKILPITSKAEIIGVLQRIEEIEEKNETLFSSCIEK